MFAGLSGEELNRRYLNRVRDQLLTPFCLKELSAASSPAGVRPPDIEDLFNLHGSIVYLGIRRFIYQLPRRPDDNRSDHRNRGRSNPGSLERGRCLARIATAACPSLQRHG